MEKLGVPATVVITEAFQGLVASYAVKLGVPGYHSVVAPHPVWTKDERGLQKLAVQLASTAWAQLGPTDV